MAALASRLAVAVALAFVIRGCYTQTTCEDPQTYVKRTSYYDVLIYPSQGLILFMYKTVESATWWPVDHGPTRATTVSHILIPTIADGGEDAAGTNTIKWPAVFAVMIYSLIPFRTRYRTAAVTRYRTEYYPTFGCCSGYQRIGNTQSCERKLYANIQW